ncbi:hypothetical protein P1X15_24015 [Runella sp. MFBS21]|uniref:hypothetical protein n=1 Tax=Runella sp. MFBS21 TaxID=3034018 RepID=UPI0023F9D99B|nr:hypothetical protein [Runella sp. MFBS21]MDF7820709.1 hypothetical protein [Runella sp. MFBS21]
MILSFPYSEIKSPFQVGDRVQVDILTLYRKPPYEFVEGVVYQVRVDFPLLSTTKRGFSFTLSEVKFRYGIQPDTVKFPKMKEVENELYDVPEEYLRESVS